MNAFDYLLIAVIVAFALTGALRGFVLEVLSLVLWPLAAFVAWFFADTVADWFMSWISDTQLRTVAGFVAVFLTVFIVGTVAVFLIHRALPLRGALRAPNVILGGLVGTLRGAVIIIIVFVVGGVTTLPQRPWWREAYLAPYFQQAAVAVSAYLPRDVARHIRYS